MKKWHVLLLIFVLIIVSGVMSGCKKQDKTPEAEKVFTMNKVEAEVSTTVAGNEDITYALYLKVVDTAFLMDDLQVVDVADLTRAKENLPLYALEKLLKFTQSKNLVNPIPAGTQLIKLEVIDGLAKVNLSKEFVPSSLKKEDAQLAVASIVNTLTYFGEIDAVELYVDGVKLSQYFGLDISKSLIFFDGLYPEK